MKILIVLCLGLSTSIYAQQNSDATEAQTRGRLRKLESRLLTMTILPGWMEHNSVDPRLNRKRSVIDVLTACGVFAVAGRLSCGFCFLRL
jgi:hypothetical protein